MRKALVDLAGSAAIAAVALLFFYALAQPDPVREALPHALTTAQVTR